MSATGKSVRVPYSVFCAIEAGKITGVRVYMPMDQLLEQIGRAEPRRGPFDGLKGGWRRAAPSINRLLALAA